MKKNLEWINRNFNRHLSMQEDERSKSIVALYVFFLGLSVYQGSLSLHYSDADFLPQARRCFEKNSLQEALVWIASLEEAYGVPIHAEVDARIDYIMASTEVQERLEKFDEQNLELLNAFLPKVETLLDELVEAKLAEPPNWVQQ